MERGAGRVDLGDGLYKMRVALGNRGKSAGARVLLAYMEGDRLIFLHGYAKSASENASGKTLRMLKADAPDLLSHDDRELADLVEAGELIEVNEP